jgi:hypothetical protein
MRPVADPEADGTHHDPRLDDAELRRWLDGLRAVAAARERSRTSWLARQAQQTSTLAGVLSDLREAGRPVMIETAAGTSHRGVVRLAGDDVVVVRTDQGVDVVVPLASLIGLRPSSVRTPTGAGQLRRHPGVGLSDVLGALAETRAAVVARCRGSRQAVRGELEVAGPEVLVVQLEGRGGVVYLPVSSLAEVSVVESG